MRNLGQSLLLTSTFLILCGFAVTSGLAVTEFVSGSWARRSFISTFKLATSPADCESV